MRLLSSLVLSLVLVLLAPIHASHAKENDVFPMVFGAGETRGASLQAFRKWLDALRRERIEAADYESNCDTRIPGCPKCLAQDWRRLLAGLRDKGRLEQLGAVHGYMNARRWVDDRVNYGMSDYWATPLEFLARGGDCEDYAFAKYVSLRRLGFPAEILRILVLDDLNAGQPHAVLLVHLDGQVWVLDNLAPTIVRASSIRHFAPIYSINETSWWLHRPTAEEQRLARR